MEGQIDKFVWRSLVKIILIKQFQNIDTMIRVFLGIHISEYKGDYQITKSDTKMHRTQNKLLGKYTSEKLLSKQLKSTELL